MSPEKYCEYIGITLPEKCRFCNEEYPPFDFILEKYENTYKISGIKLVHGDKMYCFRKK
jgi:hypothetical protein